jgi:glyoxylase-like metal-dependent hydrolase (beta-lactamase superfamily II)/rhodanese-related sulfurtransferase
VSEVSPENTWTAGELFEHLQHRRQLQVLDVRNRDEFEKLRIEGPTVHAINLPYFEMLESGGEDDMVDAVVASVRRDLADRLPKSAPVLAVCAKGETAKFVNQGLQRLGYTSATLAGGMKAWGEHYETQPIYEGPELKIYQISRTARGCLSYVLVSDRHAVVIDPLRHVHPYLNLARDAQCTIDSIIDTHGHADHISGATALSAEGSRYFLHPYDAIHPIDMLPATFSYEPIRAGQVFHFGKHELEAIHAPGHTLGMVALKLHDRYLFTGDTIFIHSVSRPDLGGKAEAWAPLHTRSLRRLLELPEQITVLPGHFSNMDEMDSDGRFQASLANLKRDNESLRVLQREDDAGFVKYLIESLPKFIPEYVEIKRVNCELASPSEEESATLETGKNVCALSQAYTAA